MGMSFYNPDFDERKYWTYGCNCLILGDRPMSDPGHGPPVDALDTVCKQYKDCQKCARATHGDSCIGEFVRYKYGEKNGDKFCKDTAGSCDRALCECDLQFAKKDVFNKDYHLFWGQGWEPKDNCPRGGSGPYDPQCCGKPSKNLKIFFISNRSESFAKLFHVKLAEIFEMKVYQTRVFPFAQSLIDYVKL